MAGDVVLRFPRIRVVPDKNFNAPAFGVFNEVRNIFWIEPIVYKDKRPFLESCEIGVLCDALVVLCGIWLREPVPSDIAGLDPALVLNAGSRALILIKVALEQSW